MTETLRWRPQRTRVFDPHRTENPWSRDGWRAQEDRAFFASLSGIPDRQEEDEDFEVLAPVRPTRRFYQPDETVLRVSEWFNPEEALRMSTFDPQYAVDYADTPAGRRYLASSRTQTGKKPKMPRPYEIRLEDNFEALDHLDLKLDRSKECWLAYRWPGSRWPLSQTSELSLRCSDGKSRRMPLYRCVWVIEYGSISSLERLKAQHPTHCLNPEHYQRSVSKGGRMHDA